METKKFLTKVTTKIDKLVIVEKYDTMGNLIQNIRYSENFKIPIFVENWEYNEKNKEIHYISEELHCWKNERWYEYDENDRLVKIRSSEYPEGETFYEYDEKGNIIKMVIMDDMGKETIINKRYNDLNEEIYHRYVDDHISVSVESVYTHYGNGKISREIRFVKSKGLGDYYTIKEYDENGNCIHCTGVLTEEFFEYDEHNHITKLTTINKDSSFPNKTIETYKNTYDTDGDIIKIEYSDGRIKTFEYYVKFEKEVIMMKSKEE